VQAAAVLVDLGETGEDLQKKLYRLHTHGDPEVARVAVGLLIKMGRVDASICRMAYKLLAGNSRIRLPYVSRTTLMSSLPDEQVRRLLSHADPLIRYDAASYLFEKKGLVDDDVLGGFRSVLSNDYAYVVWAANTLRQSSDADVELARETAQRIFGGEHGFPGVTAAAGRLLAELGHLHSALETAVRAVSSTPWIHLGICEKVIKRDPLNPSDGEALRELLRVSDKYTGIEEGYKEFLFSWLYSSLVAEGQRQS
jgi:hypothetical protein